MEASNFFTRLLRQPKRAGPAVEPDDLEGFDKAWQTVQETLGHPDERQLLKGIHATEVPRCLRHIVDALVYESNRIDEETLGACMEYFVRHDLLANLERLCQSDRPHGIKSEVLKAINNLVVLLSDRFLVHNSVHRPLRRLLRSCIGDDREEKVHGTARLMGAAGREADTVAEQDEELQGDLVDLMCTLCSRMRAYPPLLLIFFHDKGWLQPNATSITSPPRPGTPKSGTRSTRASTTAPHFEFLLFSYLLRFVHREGRIGDFARAGLLFLFDIAFLPPNEDAGPEPSLRGSAIQTDDPLYAARHALVEYITDGDFADVMAAGLGALWSLLPSKLRVPTLADLASASNEDEEDMDGAAAVPTSGGMALGSALGQQQGEKDEDIVRLSTDEDVRAQLDMLLKLLGFLQDITVRCQTASPSKRDTSDDSDNDQPTIESMGQAVIDQALDSVKRSFLDSVLYPSILECSGHDGSAVAIMTYLDTILSNLDDGRVLSRFLTYLLNTNDRDEPNAEEEERYSMRDLLVGNLSSSSASPAATTAALGLIRTMLNEHCRLSTNGLLQAIDNPVQPQAAVVKPHRPNPSDNAANQSDASRYADLLGKIVWSQDELEQSPAYTHYLTDMQTAIQDDRCYQLSLLPPSDRHEDHGLLHWDDHFGMRRPRLSPTDPLLRSLLSSLGRFLYATPDENVALTGAIISLAICPYRSLSGWLLSEEPESDPWTALPRQDTTAPTVAANDRLPSDLFSVPTAQQPTSPAIYQVIQNLVSQIHTFRSRNRDFDKLLAERRSGLLYTDNIDEAMNVMLDVEPSAPTTSIFGASPSTPTRSPTPRKRPGMMGTIASFLTPNRARPSASPSPTPAPATPPPAAGRKTPKYADDEASPYKTHYHATSSQELEASHSPVTAGAWSPARTAMERATSSLSATRPPSALSRDRAGQPGVEAMDEEMVSRKVSLSRVLDNCIILEEFLKELVGLINARRALGIDEVKFT